PGFSIYVDSAGTHAYHVGEPPDPRACRAAEQRGIDISTQRARRITEDDFQAFDMVLAMDEQNYSLLLDLSPPEHHEQIKLFMDFAPQLGRKSVPDPYFGGKHGFEQIINDSRFGGIPKILETPKENDMDRNNLALLKRLGKKKAARK
ncbi:MAG: hypothetical protein COB10_10080, partial [Planctomycetota bacterium]